MKKRTIGIEFDDRGIYFIQLCKEKGVVDIEGWELIQLPPGLIVAGKIKEPALLLERCTTLLGKSLIKSNPVIVGISGVDAFVRKLSVPLVSMKELGELIRWEGENILPVSIHEVYYHYQFLGATSSGLEVLFTAVHKDRIQPYIDLCKKSKLSIDTLTLQSFGIINFLEEMGLRAGYTGIIVRFRGQTIDLILLYQGELELVRTVFLSEIASEKAEELEVFQNEFVATLGYFQSIYDIWIKSGFFLGTREMMQKVRLLFPNFRWRQIYLVEKSFGSTPEKKNVEWNLELPTTFGLGLMGVGK